MFLFLSLPTTTQGSFVPDGIAFLLYFEHEKAAANTLLQPLLIYIILTKNRNIVKYFKRLLKIRLKYKNTIFIMDLRGRSGNMFRIGEFSKLTLVSIRMLRYYDEVGLLKPAQIDKYTGYRLYGIEQIPVLQKIVLLRDMDFSVAEIAATLNDWNKSSVIHQLSQKQQEIEKAIKIQQECISKIAIAIQDLQKDKIAVHYNMAIKSIPSCHILSLRKKIPDYFCEGELWKELFAYTEMKKIELPQPIKNVAIFHDEEHKDTDIDVEVAVIVEKLGECEKGITYKTLETVETMACIMVVGSYENIGAAYHSFAFWLEEHKQFQISGAVRQISHRGVYDNVSPNEYLTEIQVPIMKQTSNEL